jgi:hypothetical protein
MSVSAVENAKTIKVRGSWDVVLRGLCFSVVKMISRCCLRALSLQWWMTYRAQSSTTWISPQVQAIKSISKKKYLVKIVLSRLFMPCQVQHNFRVQMPIFPEALYDLRYTTPARLVKFSFRTSFEGQSVRHSIPVIGHTTRARQANLCAEASLCCPPHESVDCLLSMPPWKETNLNYYCYFSFGVSDKLTAGRIRDEINRNTFCSLNYACWVNYFCILTLKRSFFLLPTRHLWRKSRFLKLELGFK